MSKRLICLLLSSFCVLTNAFDYVNINCKVCNIDGSENTDRNFIGNINPFRYRGYYYDTESRLFSGVKFLSNAVFKSNWSKNLVSAQLVSGIGSNIFSMSYNYVSNRLWYFLTKLY